MPPLTVGAQNGLAEFYGSDWLGQAGAGIAQAPETRFSRNPAGLAELEEPLAGFSFINHFLTPELQTLGFRWALPDSNRGAWQLSAQRSGSRNLNFSEASLAYAHRLRFVSLGLRGQFRQLSQGEFGTGNAFVLSAGGQAQLHPMLRFGAWLYNITQTSYRHSGQITVPVIMQAGVEVSATGSFALLADLQKRIDQPASAKIALTYRVSRRLQLRTGFDHRIASLFAGADFQFRNWALSYGTGWSPQLGWSNGLDLRISQPLKTLGIRP